MPSYDNYPIEGYVYDEPDGRPKPGRRYRHAAGDNRVLKGLAAIFVIGVLLVGLFGWMERKNTLTEFAFGDDRFACNSSTVLNEAFIMNVADTLERYPEVEAAAALQLVVEAKTLPGQDLAGTTIVTYDLSEVDWTAGSGLRLLAPIEVDDDMASAVGMCDLELSIVETVPADAVRPTSCNLTFDGCLNLR